MFMYKILIGIHPNPGFELPDTSQTNRTGIKVKPKFKSGVDAWVKTVRASSFFSQGPKLYNLLPIELRGADNG